jgi:hypothetical protein
MPRKITAKANAGTTEKPFFFRMHHAQGRMILAACDASLMGKVLRHGEAEFDVCPEFYGREKTSAEEIARMARDAHMCNFVGKKLIAALVAAGVISGSGSGVIMIGGKIPHVQTFSL